MGFKKCKKKRSRKTLDAAEIQEIARELKHSKQIAKTNAVSNVLNNEVEISEYDKLLKYYNVQPVDDDFEDEIEVKINQLDYINHHRFHQLNEKLKFIPIEPTSSQDTHFCSFNKQFKQFKLECGVLSINEPIKIEPPGFEAYKTAKDYPFIQKLLKNLTNPSLYLPKPLIRQLNKNYLSVNNDKFDSLPLKYNYYEQLQQFEEQFNSQEFVTLYYSLSHYVDILFTDLNYSNTDIVRLCYCLHILSHIVQHRNNVTFNTGKINESSEFIEFDRDQGFTRPTVLVLLPTKSAASHIIKIFSKLLPISKNCTDKFEGKFNLNQESIEEQRQHFMKTNKPLDFMQNFNGDIDDCFRMGVRFENGLLHLFSPFYKSDIIIASPLGLRGVVASSDHKTRDYDFLSSIQILVIDSANVIQFQNWSVLLQVLETINKPIKKMIDTDIRRLRTSAIDGFSSYYRQNIVIASYPGILINDLFTRSNNCRGLIRLCKPSIESTLKLANLLKISQVFIKLESDTISNSYNTILSAFKHTIDSLVSLSKLLIVVQDYSHYLQIREALDYAQAQYKVCHEYSSNKKLSSARRDFYHGDCKMLITTFRFVFFKRYILRGGNYAIILGPPEYPPVYNHILLSLANADSRVLCYYTNYSGIALKNLLGQMLAVKLMSSDKGVSNIIT
ncbi:UTP25, DEF, U3 small nucleolar RNA-associated protein 25 [Babesia microti strain RI]|uniref:UTP25, DEF, U3 small nucleolar RNA-associated protein 25 n=1 Tax=Babesia microti (strain RI) TaxID=1133968 RepID=A0A1R4AC11_BABMR|nr:UTP25, DEF, U3 small nucleolar RNA-associated protein 25 [Babesia microti strain RI]SJK86553.1 UTP25, DEF, U3 small nucleolar RNA-associated protein 25 [Babesia microti strain RI]|eukprot:XP_021338697.1 UTP25, DEF, U3 small nucleolar RNA-associated protein 25 [Babesia microti strain RI]